MSKNLIRLLVSMAFAAWLVMLPMPLMARQNRSDGLSPPTQASQGRITNLYEVPADLELPPFEQVHPQPGKRVARTTAGWEGTQVYHSLYLPKDWVKGRQYPILVEYAGNGGYRNAIGDQCSGKVEDTRLGYGLCAGEGCIWIGMPYIEVDNGSKHNAFKWWGDIEESKKYCIATLNSTVSEFGGDSERVVLCGFSRGAIGCNVLGLHDDKIASLWRGFFCHSHYDGVREKTWYPHGEREQAIRRLHRLNGRPQWISHEVTVEPTREYLNQVAPDGPFTFEALPFPNHSDAWVLRDIPLRRDARQWLHNLLADKK